MKGGLLPLSRILEYKGFTNAILDVALDCKSHFDLSYYTRANVFIFGVRNTIN